MATQKLVQVFACEVWDSETGEDDILGVFTSEELAEKQGRAWVDSMSQHKAKYCYSRRDYIDNAMKLYFETVEENEDDDIDFVITIQPLYMDQMIHYC